MCVCGKHSDLSRQQFESPRKTNGAGSTMSIGRTHDEAKRGKERERGKGKGKETGSRRGRMPGNSNIKKIQHALFVLVSEKLSEVK